MLQSEMARLVLGYLHHTNCLNAYESFVTESPYVDPEIVAMVKDNCSVSHMLKVNNRDLCNTLRELQELRDAVEAIFSDVFQAQQVTRDEKDRLDCFQSDSASRKLSAVNRWIVTRLRDSRQGASVKITSTSLNPTATSNSMPFSVSRSRSRQTVRSKAAMRNLKNASVTNEQLRATNEAVAMALNEGRQRLRHEEQLSQLTVSPLTTTEGTGIAKGTPLTLETTEARTGMNAERTSITPKMSTNPLASPSSSATPTIMTQCPLTTTLAKASTSRAFSLVPDASLTTPPLIQSPSKKSRKRSAPTKLLTPRKSQSSEINTDTLRNSSSELSRKSMTALLQESPEHLAKNEAVTAIAQLIQSSKEISALFEDANDNIELPLGDALVTENKKNDQNVSSSSNDLNSFLDEFQAMLEGIGNTDNCEDIANDTRNSVMTTPPPPTAGIDSSLSAPFDSSLFRSPLKALEPHCSSKSRKSSETVATALADLSNTSNNALSTTQELQKGNGQEDETEKRLSNIEVHSVIKTGYVEGQSVCEALSRTQPYIPTDENVSSIIGSSKCDASSTALQEEGKKKRTKRLLTPDTEANPEHIASNKCVSNRGEKVQSFCYQMAKLARKTLSTSPLKSPESALYNNSSSDHSLKQVTMNAVTTTTTSIPSHSANLNTFESMMKITTHSTNSGPRTSSCNVPTVVAQEASTRTTRELAVAPRKIKTRADETNNKDLTIARDSAVSESELNAKGLMVFFMQSSFDQMPTEQELQRRRDIIF